MAPSDQTSAFACVLDTAAYLHDATDRALGAHHHSLAVALRKAAGARLLDPGLLRRCFRVSKAADALRHTTPFALEVLIADVQQALSNVGETKLQAFGISSSESDAGLAGSPSGGKSAAVVDEPDIEQIYDFSWGPLVGDTSTKENDEPDLEPSHDISGDIGADPLPSISPSSSGSASLNIGQQAIALDTTDADHVDFLLVEASIAALVRFGQATTHFEWHFAGMAGMVGHAPGPVYTSVAEQAYEQLALHDDEVNEADIPYDIQLVIDSMECLTFIEQGERCYLQLGSMD